MMKSRKSIRLLFWSGLFMTFIACSQLSNETNGYNIEDEVALNSINNLNQGKFPQIGNKEYDTLTYLLSTDSHHIKCNFILYNYNNAPISIGHRVVNYTSSVVIRGVSASKYALHIPEQKEFIITNCDSLSEVIDGLVHNETLARIKKNCSVVVITNDLSNMNEVDCIVKKANFDKFFNTNDYEISIFKIIEKIETVPPEPKNNK